MKKQNNKKSKFKKNLIIYISILAILCFAFLMYVLNTLYQYEASFPENYMVGFTKDISKQAKSGKASKICNVGNIEVSDLEKNNSSYDEALKQIFKSSNITTVKSANNTASKPVYDVFANDEKIMTVTLNQKKQAKRLGMFVYPVWEVEQCNLSSKRGLNYYDIVVPSNYTVKINGTELDDKYVSKTEKNESYKKLAEYVDLPDILNYQIDNLVVKPEIQILDENNNPVSYLEKNHLIEIQNTYFTGDSYDDVKDKLAGEIDVLDIAKKWSLFLTDDLSGSTHGFGQLRGNLIKGSSFYNMAYAWATSIDITFVSRHTLKNPTFTNTELKDFIVYNENAFSCVVSLEKNMRIANGQDKADKMYDRLYFVYYDDKTDNINGPTWKLVDMKAIVDN